VEIKSACKIPRINSATHAGEEFKIEDNSKGKSWNLLFLREERGARRKQAVRRTCERREKARAKTKHATQKKDKTVARCLPRLYKKVNLANNNTIRKGKRVGAAARWSQEMGRCGRLSVQ